MKIVGVDLKEAEKAKVKQMVEIPRYGGCKPD
jgi:hypothetical protein